MTLNPTMGQCKRGATKRSIYYAPGTTLYKQHSYARRTRNDTNPDYVELRDNQASEACRSKGDEDNGDDSDNDDESQSVCIFYTAQCSTEKICVRILKQVRAILIFCE